jgi:hypothetical protein
MPLEYVEIVHIPQEDLTDLANCGPEHKAIAERLSLLYETGKGNLLTGYLDKNFPTVPKDTKIRIGGGVWELCIRNRAIHLKDAGYTDVVPDRSISISVLDDIPNANAIIKVKEKTDKEIKERYTP